MEWKRTTSGGLMGLAGFLLSPLSWWNDMFVNLPLALGFGWAIAWFHPPLFNPAVIVGYWLTNVLGFYLMHRAAQRMFKSAGTLVISRPLWKDAALASGYTILILALIKLQIIEPIQGI